METLPHVLWACPKSGVKVIILSFSLFCFYLYVITLKLDLFYISIQVLFVWDNLELVKMSVIPSLLKAFVEIHQFPSFIVGMEYALIVICPTSSFFTNGVNMHVTNVYTQKHDKIICKEKNMAFIIIHLGLYTLIWKFDIPFFSFWHMIMHVRTQFFWFLEAWQGTEGFRKTIIFS